MNLCSDCRYFQPRYYRVGACTRQYAPNSKLFADDNKAGILVHITFGCIQFEVAPAIEQEVV